jgi:hypothetical protein
VQASSSVDNLLPSELCYLESGPALDLFDLRFAQGELLQYLRDEAHLVRTAREEVVVLLAPSFAATRTEDPGLPAERGVLFWALLWTCLQRVARDSARRGGRLRLLFARARPGSATLQFERSLCSILFREELARGRIELGEAAWGDFPKQASGAESRRPALLVTAGEDPAFFTPRGWARLDLSTSRPRWTGSLGIDRERPARSIDDPWEGWLVLGRKLLEVVG